MFEDVSTRSILDQVQAKLADEKARSLWRRIDSEFRSGGPVAVTSYLDSRFGEIATRLRAEVVAPKNLEEG